MENIYQQRRESVYTNTAITYTREVSCDGNQLLNSPVEEHPLVYYLIPYKTNQVSCEYCGKTFAFCDPELI